MRAGDATARRFERGEDDSSSAEAGRGTDREVVT
jgi:hypothetical protein